MENQKIKELLQRLCTEAENGDPILDQIKDCCFESATLENEGIRDRQKDLSELTEYLGFLKQDEILCLSNELCYHYARHAFSEGFYAGLRLVTEIGAQR